MNITQILSQELSATAAQITAAVELLDDGATVPFIARYRKEATGGLDDTQLRQLAERLQYLRELEERKAVVLKSIEEQGKLSDDLKAQIEAADNKTALDSGVGVCGKDGQSVPVGVGQPTLRIDAGLTVGGSEI